MVSGVQAAEPFEAYGGKAIPGYSDIAGIDLGHVVFETRRADAVMRLVNGSVCIQDWVVHNPINEVVDYGSNRVDATEALVERRLAAL